MKKYLDMFKNRALVAAAAVSTAAVSFAQESGATDAAGAMTQVSEQFTNLISSAIPIIIGLLGAAIGIFAIFAAVRWLKKALNTGSK